jgi:hypothetical protein
MSPVKRQVIEMIEALPDALRCARDLGLTTAEMARHLGVDLGGRRPMGRAVKGGTTGG